MIIYSPTHFPKEDGKINAGPLYLQFLNYFLTSALSFNYTHVIEGWFNAFTHTVSKLGCCNNHKHVMLFSVFHNKLRRSVVAAGEKQASADYRISKRYKLLSHFMIFKLCFYLHVYTFINMPIYSAWLKGLAHSIVGKLDQRISMLTGLNVKHPYGEYLQVVNYGIGGHYEPHFDHATVSWS